MSPFRLLSITPLVVYGKTLKDKLFLAGYVFTRIAGAPLALLLPTSYQKLMRALSIRLPEMTLQTPYGTYKTRKGSTDIGLLRPAYEPAIERVLLSCNGKVIIDVGANIGRHAIATAIMNPFARVIAIEPEPDNYRALVRNIRLSKLANITPVHAACAAKNSRVKIYTQGRKGHEQATINKGVANAWKNSGIVTVTGIMLDNLIKRSGINPRDVALIKIDVEGTEPEVLKGAKHVLERGHPIIVFEAWNTEQLARCTRILENKSYAVRRLDAQNFVARQS